MTRSAGLPAGPMMFLVGLSGNFMPQTETAFCTRANTRPFGSLHVPGGFANTMRTCARSNAGTRSPVSLNKQLKQPSHPHNSEIILQQSVPQLCTGTQDRAALTRALSKHSDVGCTSCSTLKDVERACTATVPWDAVPPIPPNFAFCTVFASRSIRSGDPRLSLVAFKCDVVQTRVRPSKRVFHICLQKLVLCCTHRVQPHDVAVHACVQHACTRATHSIREIGTFMRQERVGGMYAEAFVIMSRPVSRLALV